MTDLTPAIVAKVGKLLPLLASDKDGEVLATVSAMVRILEKSGACLHDVVAKLEAEPKEWIVYIEKVVYRDQPPRKEAPRQAKAEPDEQAERDTSVSGEEALRLCGLLLDAGGLSKREHDFIQQMQKLAQRNKKRFSMTVKQAVWFRRIVEDMGVDHPTEAA